MAELLPSLENIERLKVKPTAGELFLLNYMSEHLSDEYEVYFQPFLNGDMPDIIVMKRDYGVMIIEVKDWELSLYSVDYSNAWILDKNNAILRSPFQQVFGYKSNMFDLHINGLAEKNVLNKNVYKVIDTFVYFHNSSKSDIESLYSNAEKTLKEKAAKNNEKFKGKEIDFQKYEKARIYLDRKSRQIKRDNNISIHSDNLKYKINKILNTQNRLFEDDIYYEFRRYLKPPMHVASQGIDIDYGKKQSRLVVSGTGLLQKVKGVAGSGKTTVLAKRAVNGHKRHDGKILILTYNKTLRNFIRDKISDVRDDFSWGSFAILNYHAFIKSQINACGLEFSTKENMSIDELSIFYEQIYSNTSLFEGHEKLIEKYNTILIDEIQDYRPEWINIVRKYFLSEEGEMVLFGDESQNIYEREIDRDKTFNIRGFGRWERLTKSYRAQSESQLVSLLKDYQTNFLIQKYDIDTIESKPTQMQLAFDVIEGTTLPLKVKENIDDIFESIVKNITKHEIHPNDIAIVSKNIEILRSLDKKIRERTNEETMRTFEKEEVYQEVKKRESEIVYNNNSIRKEFKEFEVQKRLDIELKKLRDSLKFSFEQNSGHLKLSTIHSFKGIEASFLIYIATDKDSEEITYTAITRSKKDLILFIDKHNRYRDFFKKHSSIKMN
ncbi:nuclease-related domain-containing DEAD/DEAH box helicase [Desulfogranum mediterraneum]|uniref:nuclease-related domain-containing DEAD/DEAH box helicase n=1 Tax=Desulfogranum mediterraneum TaxID=160661 RepID=UPI0003F63031|nr:UvrD-helicase domain-containing protein [Desulfogranum mediterraneum]